MRSDATTPEQYLAALPEDRQPTMRQLRNAIVSNLSEGFAEVMNFGMLCYVVPHDRYPQGYHCDPKQPLPFLSVASQKNGISVYHMGIYADQTLLDWFVAEFPKHSDRKLDMGKSCIRFKKPELIPFDLLGQLFARMTVNDWIDIYERNLKR